MAPLLVERAVDNVTPMTGQVFSVILTLVATTVITMFLTQRILAIKVWTRLPFVVWLVFGVYVDSYIFVFATAILQHSFGLNSSYRLCEGAIFLCLACYVTTKLIYMFLVEKAHIIRGTPKKRMQSKLYIFNSFGVMSVFIIVMILNFIYRIVRLENGQCVIGMKSVGIIPLITFDALANTYLTCMFLIPLRNLYSFKNMARSPANIRLRNVAFRTFVGALCTLISSLVNLTVLMVLHGEPGWVCLMCCNADVLFSAIVVHWVTSKDNAGTASSNNSRPSMGNGYADNGSSGLGRRHLNANEVEPTPSTADEISLVTASRSQRRQSDYDDDFDSDAVLAKTTNPTGTVVVTTEIKRESRPNEAIMHNGHRKEASIPPEPPRVNRGVNAFTSPQTRISGGSPQGRR